MGRSGHVTAAGAVLIVLGSLWTAVGVVILAGASLASDPSALPDFADGVGTAAPASLALVGVPILASGLAQVGTGFALQRSRRPWPVRIGMVLALVSCAALGALVFTGMQGGRPLAILLPLVAAYLYAAWVLGMYGGGQAPAP
ncbi:MAG TPA: hypothetical protein VHK63_09230 [Candidatus Limnocylindria bacterium]|nr:hypothetical protein [Candidatus Limnocylindria bacterium]